MNITTSEDNRSIITVTNNVPESIRYVPNVHGFYTQYIASPQMGVENLDPATGNNNTVDSSSEGIVQDAAQTTVFNSEGIVSTVTKMMAKSVPSLFNSSSDSANSQDIKSFLAKPFAVATLNLSTGDSIVTPLVTIDNPYALTANNMVSPKLAGYYGFRATTVVRWVINANPFQSGRYMLVYVPVGGAVLNATKTIGAIATHTNTLYERTQLMRIEMDVSCDTEGIMKVPFSSVYNFSPVAGTASSVGGLGRFMLYAYSPLAATSGPMIASYTIYISFEDVELIGAALPQMGRESEREIKSAGQGPISSSILSFSKAARAVGEVPMLSSFSNTVAWALEIAGNGAKAFGFSKPSNQGPTQRMTPFAAAYAGQVDGIDQGVMLAASITNSVVNLPGFAGTDIDEMDITHIATIPSWIRTVSWPQASTTGTLLSTFPLCPTTYQLVRSFSGVAVTNTNPAAFVGNMFHSWRGSLVFKLKFVKTIYHSGRLSIVFIPRDSSISAAAADFTKNGYLHQQIIDIRECNEVSITVPYVSMNPYLQQGDSFGDLNIYVVDQLVSPATVPSTIPILVEMAGGPDIEFAKPLGNNTSIGGAQGTVFIGATPQMGEECSLVDTTIGSTNISASTTINSEICIGEKVVSFRSLLKIFRVQGFQTAKAAAQCQSMTHTTINAHYWDATPTLNLPYAYGDLYDLLGACYLYSRGGMAIKWYSGPIAHIAYLQVGNSASEYIIRANVDSFGTAVSNRALNGGKYVCGHPDATYLEVLAPQYGNRHSRNNMCHIANPQAGYAVSASDVLGPSSCVVLIRDPVGAFPVVALTTFRAVADDFSFGGFISTVPVRYYSANTFT